VVGGCVDNVLRAGVWAETCKQILGGPYKVHAAPEVSEQETEVAKSSAKKLITKERSLPNNYKLFVVSNSHTQPPLKAL
jgi:hypothetical protein